MYIYLYMCSAVLGKPYQSTVISNNNNNNNVQVAFAFSDNLMGASEFVRFAQETQHRKKCTCLCVCGGGGGGVHSTMAIT